MKIRLKYQHLLIESIQRRLGCCWKFLEISAHTDRHRSCGNVTHIRSTYIPL